MQLLQYTAVCTDIDVFVFVLILLLLILVRRHFSRLKAEKNGGDLGLRVWDTCL